MLQETISTDLLKTKGVSIETFGTSPHFPNILPKLRVALKVEPKKLDLVDFKSMQSSTSISGREFFRCVVFHLHLWNNWNAEGGGDEALPILFDGGRSSQVFPRLPDRQNLRVDANLSHSCRHTW